MRDDKEPQVYPDDYKDGMSLREHYFGILMQAHLANNVKLCELIFESEDQWWILRDDLFEKAGDMVMTATNFNCKEGRYEHIKKGE